MKYFVYDFFGSLLMELDRDQALEYFNLKEIAMLNYFIKSQHSIRGLFVSTGSFGRHQTYTDTFNFQAERIHMCDIENKHSDDHHRELGDINSIFEFTDYHNAFTQNEMDPDHPDPMPGILSIHQDYY
jgi:uncharacterized radical SAM superfamily Fe-S cluster-containing enzyme